MDRNNLRPGTWLIEGRAETCYVNPAGYLLLTVRDGDGDARNAVLTDRVKVSDGDAEIPLGELPWRCRESGDPKSFPAVLVGLDGGGAWGVALRPYDADPCELAWAEEGGVD